MQEREFNDESWWPYAVCECNADCHGNIEGWCSQRQETYAWNSMRSPDTRFYGLTGVVVSTDAEGASEMTMAGLKADEA